MRPKSRQILIAALAILALAVASVLYFRRQAPSQALDPQMAALAQLSQDSQREPMLHFYDGFPGFAEISISVEGDVPVERARNFLSAYQDLYLQNDPDLSLEVLRQEGEVVVFFQAYKALRVFAAQMAVNMEDDTVFATVGRLLTSEVERQALDLLPAITDQDAIAIARVELDLAEAKVIGSPELVVFDPSFVSDAPAIAHLAWQFTLHGGQTRQVLVDANTGELLFSTSFSLNYIDLDMQDAQNEAYSDDDSCYDLSNDPYVGDESNFNSDYNSDEDAVNAYDQIFKAYNFYLDQFNRDSYDNDNGQLEVFINATVPDAPNADWSPYCELLEFSQGSVDYDVMVHELTHGVISETSDLIYSYQSGALNESYADVMAVIADQLDGDNNWAVGENRTNGMGAVRTISNPNFMSDFVITTGDYWGVHINSVIPSYAAYLIADGGGNALHPIGIFKTVQLYYSIMTTLPDNSSFSMASGLTIAKANWWALNGTQGFTSEDACQVRNAFATIGLEQPDFDCDGEFDGSDNDDDGDGAMDWEDNCAGLYNPDQTDANFNGIGEACDPDEDDDFDDDTVNNDVDNCPFDYNLGQENDDADLDNDGDVCDPDDDNDGLSNDNDNCPFISNILQTDSDGDGAGDYCDKCPNTTEEITAWTSGIPELGIEPKPLQPDNDGDGVPNACDDDFIVIGDNWENAIKNIHAFELIDVTLDGEPSDLLILPLPACMPAENGAEAPRLDRNFVLEGLDPNIFLQLVNGEGMGAGKPKSEDGLAMLSITNPLGGDKYFLQLLLGLDYQAGESSFNFSYNCSEPEEGQPAAAATPIPLVELIAIPDRNANCRLGPSSSFFDIVDTLLMGMEYMPVGQGPDQMWLLFTGPVYGGRCWVLIDNLDLFCNDAMVEIADISPCTLPITQYPPLPTLTPTPTFTPEASTPQCSDGIDNDSDGLVDLSDRECRHANDNDEAN